ncbi:MAG: 16S rRNA (adenine(1518)-N(6)/adenine(1519)-N(6))-dimethyltransferase RsmA [Syntrophobacteraceae bacterium]
MGGFITPRHYFNFHGTRPRKRFGQHFLSQPNTAERIVRSAELEPSDVVVEVGPGLGALTQFILPSVRRLHLVELDRDLAEYLQENIPPSECRVFIHQQDILTFDIEDLSEAEGQRLVVLGNLPYNISSPLVFHLLESLSAVKRSVFMVQREVGERFAAVPGTKEYGVLSVLLGIYARVSRLFLVGPQQFYPPPNVDSLVLSIEFPEAPPADAPSFEFLRNLVNIAFQQRRKMLRNSLSVLAGKNTAALDEAFSESGIDPKRRPESLSPEEFLRFGCVLARTVGSMPGK